MFIYDCYEILHAAGRKNWMGGVHGVRISLKELDIPAIFSWLVIQERFGATFSPAGQEQPSPGG